MRGRRGGGGGGVDVVVGGGQVVAKRGHIAVLPKEFILNYYL